MNRLLRPADVAEMLQVHERSVLRFVRDGRLTGVQNPLTRRWRIDPESVKELIKKCKFKSSN
jgi:excisionase family DNA binding protein